MSGDKEKMFWLYSSLQSEEKGHCMGSLNLILREKNQPFPANESRGHNNVEIHESYVNHFVRNSTQHHSTKRGWFSDGEQVLLSVENSVHFALTRGTVRSATENGISVWTKRPLRVPDGGPMECQWRVDRDIRSSLISKMRQNLVDLCGTDQHARRLRSLIIDMERPEDANPNEICESQPFQVGGAHHILNKDQIVAFNRILSLERDYTLIYGMPGTGKTAVLTLAVCELAKKGKRILLTSFTNSALDNLLSRIVDSGTAVLRVGNPESVHEKIRPFCLNGSQTSTVTSVDKLRCLIKTSNVFGCTCYGALSPLMKQVVRESLFDVAIVDESTQISIPSVVGPLLCAKAFCLVGDHNQLPPLVVDKTAARRGMDESLFSKLYNTHPMSAIEMGRQYRMASDIMDLSNTLVYEGKLSCANKDVAERIIQYRNEYTGPKADIVSINSSVMKFIMDPLNRVVYVDTSSRSEQAMEQKNGDIICNEFESNLACSIAQEFLNAGIQADEILLLSPLRAQVSMMSQRLNALPLTGIEALTVDKAQGCDRECVILSMVRANALQDS